MDISSVITSLRLFTRVSHSLEDVHKVFNLSKLLLQMPVSIFMRNSDSFILFSDGNSTFETIIYAITPKQEVRQTNEGGCFPRFVMIVEGEVYLFNISNCFEFQISQTFNSASSGGKEGTSNQQQPFLYFRTSNDIGEEVDIRFTPLPSMAIGVSKQSLRECFQQMILSTKNQPTATASTAIKSKRDSKEMDELSCQDEEDGEWINRFISSHFSKRRRRGTSSSLDPEQKKQSKGEQKRKEEEEGEKSIFMQEDEEDRNLSRVDCEKKQGGRMNESTIHQEKEEFFDNNPTNRKKKKVRRELDDDTYLMNEINQTTTTTSNKSGNEDIEEEEEEEEHKRNMEGRRNEIDEINPMTTTGNFGTIQSSSATVYDVYLVLEEHVGNISNFLFKMSLLSSFSSPSCFLNSNNSIESFIKSSNHVPFHNSLNGESLRIMREELIGEEEDDDLEFENLISGIDSSKISSSKKKKKKKKSIGRMIRSEDEMKFFQSQVKILNSLFKFDTFFFIILSIMILSHLGKCFSVQMKFTITFM